MARLDELLRLADDEVQAAMADLVGDRDEDWRRVSAMAGLDEAGNIAPPPAGATINRDAPLLWNTRNYGVE